MSLYLRLILRFSALAAVIAVVCVISIRESREIEKETRKLLESTVRELDSAVAMELALQESRHAAYQMLAASYRAQRLGTAAAADRQAAEASLWQEIRRAERLLAAAEAATLAGIAMARDTADDRTAASVQEELDQWLEPLGNELKAFSRQVREFVRLSREDAEAADEFLRTLLEPALEEALIHRVASYRLAATEEVSEEARKILAEASSATRLVMGASVFAVVLSILLGLTAAHSLAKPVTQLRNAAVDIGKGNLETRVELRSRDEIGQLAASFNEMATELSNTTVSKSYLDEVIDTMAGALIVVDPTRAIRSVNRAGLDLLGYEEAELQGEPIDLICPEQDPVNTGSLVRLSDDRRVRNLDRNFVHKDGTVIPVSFSGSTLRDARGNVRVFVCIAHDISQRKLMEQRLRASLREKELLLREVHHRVKNNLQVISSLLDLQSEHTRDPQHLAFVKDSRNRIRSMALIHEQLYRADDLGEIHLRPYLEELVGHLFRSFGIEPGRVALRSRLEELTIDLDRAIACGLILSELVSNSLKHAFPDGASGEVSIELSAPDEDTLRLVVGDDGRGLDGALDLHTSQSMGLTLVTMMAKQLHGTMDVRHDGGVEFRIDFPRQSVSPNEP